MAEENKSNHERNVEGLRQYAKDIQNAKRYKCQEAIKILLRERKVINFRTVADLANVSVDYLYKHTDIRDRIKHLRETTRPKIPVPKPERASGDSKNSIIAALRLRIMNLEEENRELRAKNEVAYGLVRRN